MKNVAAYKAIFIFLAVLALSIFSPRFCLLAQDIKEVEVTSISGKVEVLLSDAEDYTAAEEGMKLEAGDTISTGDDGSAEMSFNEQNTNVVKLSANTETQVLLLGDEKLEAAKGEIFASVAELPQDSAFEIRTPTAVTGARGTDWVTKVSEDGTDVEAVDDNPYVKEIQKDGTVAREATMVLAGHATTVRPFQKPVPLRKIAESDRNRWREIKSAVKERAAQAVTKRNERPPFDRGNFIKKMQEQGRMRPLRSGAKNDRPQGGLKDAPGGVLRSGQPDAGRKFDKGQMGRTGPRAGSDVPGPKLDRLKGDALQRREPGKTEKAGDFMQRREPGKMEKAAGQVLRREPDKKGKATGLMQRQNTAGLEKTGELVQRKQDIVKPQGEKAGQARMRMPRREALQPSAQNMRRKN